MKYSQHPESWRNSLVWATSGTQVQKNHIRYSFLEMVRRESSLFYFCTSLLGVYCQEFRGDLNYHTETPSPPTLMSMAGPTHVLVVSQVNSNVQTENEILQECDVTPCEEIINSLISILWDWLSSLVVTALRQWVIYSENI